MPGARAEPVGVEVGVLPGFGLFPGAAVCDAVDVRPLGPIRVKGKHWGGFRTAYKL